MEAFLRACNELPEATRQLKKAHIWRAAKHSQSRQFEYWQSGSSDATRQDEETFGRLLAMTPADFVELLARKGIL